MATTTTPAVLERIYEIRKENAVYRHAGETPDLEAPDESVAVEPVTESLLDRVVVSAETREKFRRFLDAGHQGCIAHDDGEVVSRGWICTPESTAVPYNLPEWVSDMDVYWLFYARTREEYRRRGWHTYVLGRRLERVYDRDSNARVFTDAVADNVSRHTFLSTGFEPAGMMTTYRIGHPALGVKQFGAWEPGADHPPLPDDDADR